MSLLFLTELVNPFQALDDAGVSLPSAVLTFWQSGTTEPAEVYADLELQEPLTDALGRVLADEAGIFPVMFMDPAVRYRVRLQTAAGVLRWDVEYLCVESCDCAGQPQVFRGPVVQAMQLASAQPIAWHAPPLPGARLRFSVTGGDTPADVYADAGQTIRLPNPVVANAAGIFPPIYLQTAVSYRVRLISASGTTLIDVDPYVRQCGMMIVTSRPYAIEAEDALGISASATGGLVWMPPEDALSLAVLVLSGEMREILRAYGDALPEALELSASVLGGTLQVALKEYLDALPEALELSASVLGGTLEDKLKSYTNWTEEALQLSVSVLGGSLS